MKMRVFLMAVITAIFALTANAQVGIQVGYLNSVNKIESEKSDPLNGFNIGVTYDYNFNDYVGLQTGLLYSMTFEMNKATLMGVTMKTTSMGHYATLPVNVKGSYSIGRSGLSVFAFLGPDFILGVAGTTKTEIGNEEISGNWYDDGSQLKRFDIALGMGAGIQYNHVRVKFGYDLGLINLSDDNDFKMKRNHFNVSLGILF